MASLHGWQQLLPLLGARVGAVCWSERLPRRFGLHGNMASEFQGGASQEVKMKAINRLRPCSQYTVSLPANPIGQNKSQY